MLDLVLAVFLALCAVAVVVLLVHALLGWCYSDEGPSLRREEHHCDRMPGWAVINVDFTGEWFLGSRGSERDEDARRDADGHVKNAYYDLAECPYCLMKLE